MNTTNQTKEIANQTKKITFTSGKTQTSERNMYLQKDFTFVDWVGTQFKTVLSDRYGAHLICQTEICEEEAIYKLEP